VSYLKELYQIEKYAIVANAGLLSRMNLEDLQAISLDYIVGAQTGNTNPEEVNQLDKADKGIIKSYTVFYDYTAAKVRKDKMINQNGNASGVVAGDGFAFSTFGFLALRCTGLAVTVIALFGVTGQAYSHAPHPMQSSLSISGINNPFSYGTV